MNTRTYLHIIMHKHRVRKFAAYVYAWVFADPGYVADSEHRF